MGRSYAAKNTSLKTKTPTKKVIEDLCDKNLDAKTGRIEVLMAFCLKKESF